MITKCLIGVTFRYKTVIPSFYNMTKISFIQNKNKIKKGGIMYKYYFCILSYKAIRSVIFGIAYSNHKDKQFSKFEFSVVVVFATG